MSSRNVRLDKKSRAKAVEIVKTLRWIKRLYKSQVASGKSEVREIDRKAVERLAAFPEFQVEYVAIRDAKTLKPLKKISATTHAVALIAAHIGGVRLIDNMLL
jgi:pantoate--beta-alanine ligase